MTFLVRAFTLLEVSHKSPSEVGRVVVLNDPPARVLARDKFTVSRRVSRVDRPCCEGLKYSKRGVVSSQAGQVSNSALKRIREGREAANAKKELSAEEVERANVKRKDFQATQSQEGFPPGASTRPLISST